MPGLDSVAPTEGRSVSLVQNLLTSWKERRRWPRRRVPPKRWCGHLDALCAAWL